MTVLALLFVSLGAHAADVRYANGNTALAAELLLPAGEGPFPAAVILHGSGPSDRTNTWARGISDLLVANGLAVLLTDKRSDWQTASFDDLAGDALAGVRLLRTRGEIDKTRIGLVGLSQGGWVAPLAAAKSNDVAFVIDIVGATVSYAEQTFVEMTNTARQAGVDVDEVVRLNRAAGRYLINGDWNAYAAARERALAGPAKKVAAGFPGQKDAKIWTFLRSVMAYDPMPYWTVLEQPVLFVFGELDERDNVPVQESVRRIEFAFGAAGKKNYEVAVIPAVGHALMIEGNKFAPRFTETLAAWLAPFRRAPSAGR